VIATGPLQLNTLTTQIWGTGLMARRRLRPQPPFFALRMALSQIRFNLTATRRIELTVGSGQQFATPEAE
jgi:hypothetical protein